MRWCCTTRRLVLKELFGRGPTKARSSFAGPDLIVSTLECSLTRIERLMADASEHERLRDLRKRDVSAELFYLEPRS